LRHLVCGVVHQDINSSELADGIVDQLSAETLVTNIARKVDCVSARCAYQPQDLSRV
jgi:hypothetical protein